MKLRHQALLLGASILPCCGWGGELNEFIAVSATAAPDYHRVYTAGILRPESYVFSEGKYSAGGTVDHSLERLTFADLLKVVAPQLARQKYYPTRDAGGADLVIIVHWGATLGYDDPQGATRLPALRTALPEYQAAATYYGYANPRALNFIGDSAAWTAENRRAAVARNAELLGFARELDKVPFGDTPFHVSAYATLYTDLTEDRYYVVLMAYDYRALRKEKKAKLQWVTRLSVRTAGNSFGEALPVLARAGGEVYGQQLPGLARLAANVREGRVSVRELSVLGFSGPDEPAPDRARQPPP